MKKLDDVSQLGLQYQTQLMKGAEETKHGLLRHMSTIMDMLDSRNRSVKNIVLGDNRTLRDDNVHTAERLSQLIVAMDVTRHNDDRRQEDLEKLRAELERKSAQQKMFEFDQSDGFVYNISILSRKDGVRDAAPSTHCRATLDTACDENWASKAIIERADLHGNIGVVMDPDAFGSSSGHTKELQGQVQLTFYPAKTSEDSQQTRTETFYVFHQLPVDVVLVKGFISKQFTLVSKHALGLVRHDKFTQGPYLSCIL